MRVEKRIHVPFNESINKSISARNALWLLVFCEGLEEAAIGCSLDKNNDAAYLKEYSQDFKGLSRVKNKLLDSRLYGNRRIRVHGGGLQKEKENGRTSSLQRSKTSY